jgi:hypothetical protein
VKLFHLHLTSTFSTELYLVVILLLLFTLRGFIVRLRPACAEDKYQEDDNSNNSFHK